jgi:hypothetical protein
MPLLDMSLRPLFDVFDVERLLLIFAAVLTEQRILIVSVAYIPR